MNQRLAMLMNILLIAAKRRAVSVSRFDVSLEDPLTHKNPMILLMFPVKLVILVHHSF